MLIMGVPGVGRSFQVVLAIWTIRGLTEKIGRIEMLKIIGQLLLHYCLATQRLNRVPIWLPLYLFVKFTVF